MPSDLLRSSWSFQSSQTWAAVALTSSLVMGFAVSGCERRSPPAGGAPSATLPTTVATPGSAGALPSPRPSSEGPLQKRLRAGPVLAILPGQGVGPIRFGATVETIERLMEAPCDVKTETVCRFVDRALEFTLANGALVEVLIHRRDRPAAPLPGQSPQLPSTFGAYNGALPPDPDTGAKLPVDFGMHRQAVEEALGKPQRIERVEANPNGTVERLSYPGLVLELDEYPAAREPVVGGFRVIKKK